MNVRILDLQFLGIPFVIGSFLIESNDGLILIETGPDTAFSHLKEAIQEAGYHWKNVRHVLLTHIHFDHAGAAWRFAENKAKIYVHPIGLPHMNDPMRLWNSAQRIYGDDMERLWGEMRPIASDLLVPVEDGALIEIGGLRFITHYTPGHAIHHNAYQLESILFTGDVAGVKIGIGPVVPPCPPPDINIEIWKDSIAKLINLNSEILYLTHYGKVNNPTAHLNALEEILLDWALWIKPFSDQAADPVSIIPQFIEYTQNQLRQAGVNEEGVEQYEKANPSFMSVTGLMRYWKLKRENQL